LNIFIINYLIIVIYNNSVNYMRFYHKYLSPFIIFNAPKTAFP
jgi:hypothetical protein